MVSGLHLGIVAAAAALVLVAARARRRGRRRFAELAHDPPLKTQQALAEKRWLPLRHEAALRAIDRGKLEAAFDDIVEAFKPQQVDYSNAAYGKELGQQSEVALGALRRQ